MIPAATGYGPEGPDSHKPAFALTGEARSGSLWWGGPNGGPVLPLGDVAGDQGHAVAVASQPHQAAQMGAVYLLADAQAFPTPR